MVGKASGRGKIKKDKNYDNDFDNNKDKEDRGGGRLNKKRQITKRRNEEKQTKRKNEEKQTKRTSNPQLRA